jgi:hypothetical protein
LLHAKAELAKEKLLAIRVAASSQKGCMELDWENKVMEGLEKKAKLLLELTGEVPKELIDSIKKITANAALSAVVQSEASLDRVNKRRLEEADIFNTPADAGTRRRDRQHASPQTPVPPAHGTAGMTSPAASSASVETINLLE